MKRKASPRRWRARRAAWCADRGHLSLTEALQAKADATHPDSIEFLTTLNPTDWIELVFEHGVPPGSGLDNDEFIEQLQSGVESKFPMVMLGKQLAQEPVASETFPAGKIVDFLKANPAFDLRMHPVEPYLSDAGNQDDALREGLLQLQRIHVLTDNARETGALLDAGFGSSAQIVSGGEPAFARQVSGQLSPERAATVFAAASKVVATVVALGTAYAPGAVSGRAVAVIPCKWRPATRR